MATADLTAARLREVLHYDPATGVARWVSSNGRRAVAGHLAGSKGPRGYTSVQIDGKKYKLHRLAWLYVHGCWPASCIDHINGRTDDNRLVNLRAASVSVNAQNVRRARVDNKATGLLGVTKKTKCINRYDAVIRVGGRAIYLGSFGSPEDAHVAYLAAKRVLHEGCTI